jgi:hypothetical protein
MTEPAYRPCWRSTSIRLPNGAYSFAHCTLLTLGNSGHEGECKFAFTLYEMLRPDVVKL